MTNVIETVARAIQNDDGSPCISTMRLGLCKQADGCVCRSLARAALLALREPTDEMVVAGLNAGYEHNRPKADRLKGDGEAFERCAASLASHITAGDGSLYKAAYQAMISTAMEDASQ